MDFRIAQLEAEAYRLRSEIERLKKRRLVAGTEDANRLVRQSLSGFDRDYPRGVRRLLVSAWLRVFRLARLRRDLDDSTLEAGLGTVSPSCLSPSM